MARKKLVILPKLCDCGGDLKKKWYVHYSVRNPQNDKMYRFRVYEGIQLQSTKKGRYHKVQELIEDLTRKLKTGWSPFLEETECIYEDQLQYSNVASIYGRKRADNAKIRYYCSKFLDYIQSGLEPATVSTYTSKLRVFTQWCEQTGIGNNDVSTLDNPTILNFFDWIINKRNLSGNSVSKYHQILYNLFDFMKDEKKILENPVYNIPKCNRINDQSPAPVHEMDIEVFKKVIGQEDPQLMLAIEMEYYCAIRPGNELRFLKIGDLDLVRATVRVSRSRAKKRKTRTVVIPHPFLVRLRGG